MKLNLAPRKRRGGPPSYTQETFRQRTQLTPGGCWEWQRRRDRFGYGQGCLNNCRTRAHRIAYMLFIGPIPDGMEVCHRCNNKSCVNPDHLYVATHQQNMRDAVNDGLIVANDWAKSGEAARRNFPAVWKWRREKPDCPHGHPYSGDNLYLLPNGARVCRTCQRHSAAIYRDKKRAMRST